jgi:hypothetical protein
VSVAWQSGNPNIQVQDGAILNFTPANWNIEQTVTLESNAETGTIIYDRAIFRCTGAGLAPCQVTALWVEKLSNISGLSILMLEDD